MKKIGLPKQGNWYKGNLHCHSTNSDGSLTPQEVAKLYKEHGYQFLALSDHDIYSDYRSELDEDGFIILPAIEASAVLYLEEGSPERICVHHIHGILGTEEMQKEAKKGSFSHLEKYPPRKYYGKWDGLSVAQELSDDLKAHGCITTYNHPLWSRVNEDEFIDIEGVTALEIYNYGSVNESATGFDTVHWDVMLKKGKQMFGFASDDNHNDGIIKDSFGGYIMVKAEKLDHESILRAILAGEYYSSNGPEIYDWGIEDGVAYVKCSPSVKVNFVAGNYINAGGVVMDSDGDETITEAKFRLKGNESYIRVECEDKFGKMAWSNPIMLG